MSLDFSEKGKVIVSMQDYINGILSEVPDDLGGSATTPAKSGLFEINKMNSGYLERHMAETFQYLVAKLLFLCKRGRAEIQIAIAFLCTRVKQPKFEDFRKLGRVIQYLRGSIDTVLTLESNNTHIIKWWVDASFASHNNMKSHTGGIMTLGKGAMYAISTPQKVNTRSSTEAEFVAEKDVMPQILWTRNFLSNQGINLKDNIVYQE